MAEAADLAVPQTAADLEAAGAEADPGAVGAGGCSIKASSRFSFSLSSRKCRAMAMT